MPMQLELQFPVAYPRIKPQLLLVDAVQDRAVPRGFLVNEVPDARQAGLACLSQVCVQVLPHDIQDGRPDVQHRRLALGQGSLRHVRDALRGPDLGICRSDRRELRTNPSPFRAAEGPSVPGGAVPVQHQRSRVRAAYRPAAPDGEMTATPCRTLSGPGWGVMTYFQVCPFQCSATARVESEELPTAQALSADDVLTAARSSGLRAHVHRRPFQCRIIAEPTAQTSLAEVAAEWPEDSTVFRHPLRAGSPRAAREQGHGVQLTLRRQRPVAQRPPDRAVPQRNQ